MFKKKINLGLLILSSVVVAACGGGGEGDSSNNTPDPAPAPAPAPPSPPTGSFEQSELIASIVDNVYIPAFELFQSESQSLVTSIESYCSALPDTSGEARNAAQDQWKNAMAAWQMIELMQVGPLAENEFALRNRIYSWPNTSACSVDQDVVASEESGYDITVRTNPRKGLDALEYLLFDNDLNHKCTTFGSQPEGWNNRIDSDRVAARCSFATLVVEDLAQASNEVVGSWIGTNGYGEVIKAAGEPGSDFATALEAINDISDGMFYFTKAMKDGKIATPVGIKANNCGLEPCPEDAESVYSDVSLNNIINNMKALRILLIGGEEDDTGFIDFLNDVGDSDTAQNIIVSLDEAIRQAESINVVYSEVLENNPEAVEQLHTDVDEVDNIMKGDFIQSLSLELPATSAGDND